MDPKLWEIIYENGFPNDREVEAIIRLKNKSLDIPGIRIISRFGNIATCRLLKSSIAEVHAHPHVISLKAPHPLGPEREPLLEQEENIVESAMLQTDHRRPLNHPYTGQGIIIGIIDWGCDFKHPCFRTQEGSSRILALWDQRGKVNRSKKNPYGYGNIYSRKEINLALGQVEPYKALNYNPADSDSDGSGSHGTHVMGIAAGNGRGGGPKGMAPGAELVFVHLANKPTKGMANLGDSVRILEAIDFIAKVAGPKPWVVNLSVGKHGGPHDGRTLTELACDSILKEEPGRFIVQSCGNYHRKRIHTSGFIKQGEYKEIEIFINKADTSINELELWYAGQDRINVLIEVPNGRKTQAVSLGKRKIISKGKNILARIYNRKKDPNNGDNQVGVFIYPNGPMGNWKVNLFGEKVSDGKFHAWLERDDCTACQSYFPKEDSNPFFTIGTLANSRIPLIVGAYNNHHSLNPIASFSSAGPTRDNRPKPDLVCPGVEILSCKSTPKGQLNNPGLYTRKSGTSMAAPYATGVAALCMEAAGRPISAVELREIMMGSTSQASKGIRALRYGRGILQANLAIQKAEQLYQN